MNLNSLNFFGVLIAGTLWACSKTDTSTDEPVIDDGLATAYQQFYNVNEVYQDGDMVVVECEGVPDHKSPYYQGTAWEEERYEDYDGSNPDFHQNPNEIGAQNYTFRIPLNPQVDESHSATPLGPIGVALNGVAIFNQYAAPGDDLSEEINTFDHYNGHPTGTQAYHYHVEPLYLTNTLGQDALLGFLLDGFPLYGPVENGEVITNDDLDAYHGHEHATPEFPEGIYHYHVTAEDPYINGDGFYGTPGTVSH